MTAKQDVARISGVAIETLEVWLEQRWLMPEGTKAGPHFAERDVARARFIADLRGAMGVNDAGIDVILHLVDQLHGLRHALAALRDTMPDAPP